MAIISKPAIIVKGEEALFTLFKGELANNSVVASDVYFSNQDNWMQVKLNYISSEGNQYKTVTFNSFENFNPAVFYASPRARDEFIIDSINIIDFDGQILEIPRTSLNTLHFDINFNSESEEAVFLLEDGNSLLLESGDFLLL